MSESYKEYLKEGMIKNFFKKMNLNFARHTFIDLCDANLIDCDKIKFGEHITRSMLTTINHYQPKLTQEQGELLDLYNIYVKENKPKKVWIDEVTENGKLPNLTEAEKIEFANLIKEYHEII